ncbi:MAG TPA: hypothetical protein VFF52_25685, partial [Isosphaeraceae bacterium]|nr:hypothetical protein [Isosphaeraceae bacterium]
MQIPINHPLTDSVKAMPHRVRIGITVLVGYLAIVAGVAVGQEAGETPLQPPAVKTVPDQPPQPRPAARPAGKPKPKVVIGPVQIRKRYQFSVGPWSGEFSVPES